ncbi:hypothetical protein [Micromonospora haikouensis]|uniref:hypothetical protein n=1 Tax=Micromonospora haikouensis TaxID=686309 RepID=UPI0033CC8FDF
MEERNISGYIIIGTGIRYLMHVQEGHELGGDGNVMDNIQRFVRACETHGLHVTERLAILEFGPIVQAIIDSRSAEVNDIKEIEGKLPVVDAAKIRTSATKIRSTLLAEANGLFVHVARDKRFATEKLLKKVPTLMSPGVFDRLPRVAQYDFTEAGRCIAFETPTAAAFHLMRGTEDVLRFFYCSIIKRERRKLMWGPMVDHLRRRRNPPPLVLLNNLDSLRVSFRNPTQHPDKIYDIEEVQDLLNLSIDVVNRMIKYVDPLTSASRDVALEALTSGQAESTESIVVSAVES